jgi:tRNA (guanine-N7-)-methyltransferase
MNEGDAEADRRRRPIRSFVRRSGRLTPSQQRALGTLWPDYGLDAGAGRLELDAAFGRRMPRVLEIGFGNGESLVSEARAHPELDFLGIEVHDPGIGHCLLAARAAGLSNLRVVAADALDVLETGIPAASLRRINLYFPDPWPKKRHHKRRIVQPAFVDLCAAALEAGGTLRIATDWADYAEHIEAVLAASDRFALTERREHAGDAPLERPATKFERRGVARGHRIVDWIFTKCG